MNLCAAAVFFLTAAVLNGCASLPFEPVELSPVSQLDPNEVRRNFKDRLTDKFEIVETAVLNYRGHEIISLGYSEIDEKNDSLAVAGFTPLGVKIFEMKAAGDKAEGTFSIPQPGKTADPGKAAAAMAEDVRRIYLGRVPGDEAQAFKAKDKIHYRQVSGQGELEFIFGGPDTALIEKHYRTDGRKIWTVRYFEYTYKDSKMYPSKVLSLIHI